MQWRAGPDCRAPGRWTRSPASTTSAAWAPACSLPGVPETLRGQHIPYDGVYGVKLLADNGNKPFILLEHRMGVEPMNTGFADQRVSHFATGALVRHAT